MIPLGFLLRTSLSSFTLPHLSSPVRMINNWSPSAGLVFYHLCWSYVLCRPHIYKTEDQNWDLTQIVVSTNSTSPAHFLLFSIVTSAILQAHWHFQPVSPPWWLHPSLKTLWLNIIIIPLVSLISSWLVKPWSLLIPPCPHWICSCVSLTYWKRPHTTLPCLGTFFS